ncbi:preprotein translocase subunit SecA [bacterium]|nr:preprotein translocase subunit SecA [bacterium]
MIAGLLAKILGTNNTRQLRKLRPIVEQINALEESTSKLSDEQLIEKTNEFRGRITKGESLDDILPEAYAAVREVGKRKLGMRIFDVQMVGGIVLHQAKIAEMKTGEGKTLTATMPLYLNALMGKGAHLVTPNDYLAKRDSEWMSPIYKGLGLTVSCLGHDMDDETRKEAYQADILYATNNELGFDYLRDNMKFRLSDYAQKGLNYAIVDEVDSILIDEARTPLIISGPAQESSELYVRIDRIIPTLIKGTDFEVDEKARSSNLTELGNDKIEAALGVKNLYAIENLKLLHHVNQALKAHSLFRRDVDYIVKENQVLIVDEFTGRALPGRRYSDGLHQALEAKEELPIERESQTLASITLQNYFRLYGRLAGMTGTAMTDSEEFHNIYNLDVISIPTNVNIIRDDKADLIFLTQRAKFKAIVEDIKGRYKKGQPVLVGTIAVETSEMLSQVLTQAGIPHEVLNAKQHAREAEIVAHAGEPGHITIATNMAGRGTDIKLTPESLNAGGLYILGTDRHESRRIDNQLRGRAGRQGDPGDSRFYISLEDELIRIFAGDTMKRQMERFGMTEDETIESSMVSKTIERAQEKVEKHNFDIRKHLLEYDDVLNNQRTVIYEYRRSVLVSEEDIYQIVRDLIIATVSDLIAWFCPKRKVDTSEIKQVFEVAGHMAGIKPEDFSQGLYDVTTSDDLKSGLVEALLLKYDLFRNSAPAEALHNAEKWLVLESIDEAWKQHMLNLDALKEGINLRGWGQKNPLIEYKKEAFVMFQDMMRSIRSEIVHHIYHLQLDRFDSSQIEEKRERELQELQMGGSAGSNDSDDGDDQKMNRAQRRAAKKGRR